MYTQYETIEISETAMVEALSMYGTVKVGALRLHATFPQGSSSGNRSLRFFPCPSPPGTQGDPRSRTFYVG